MWLTGFDAPSCSTVYVDKPMRNHTLMQTIARANRVYPGKHSGVMVDYANVFAWLERALAIYGIHVRRARLQRHVAIAVPEQRLQIAALPAPRHERGRPMALPPRTLLPLLGALLAACGTKGEGGGAPPPSRSPTTSATPSPAGTRG
jgi:hypothetical protein